MVLKSSRTKGIRDSNHSRSDRALAIFTCVKDFLATHCTHPALICTLLAVDTWLHKRLFAYSARLLIRLHLPAPQKTIFTPYATSTPDVDTNTHIKSITTTSMNTKLNKLCGVARPSFPRIWGDHFLLLFFAICTHHWLQNNQNSKKKMRNVKNKAKQTKKLKKKTDKQEIILGSSRNRTGATCTRNRYFTTKLKSHSLFCSIVL